MRQESLSAARGPADADVPVAKICSRCFAIMASPRAQLGAYKVSKPPSFGLVPSPPKKNGKVRVAAIRTRDARALR